VTVLVVVVVVFRLNFLTGRSQLLNNKFSGDAKATTVLYRAVRIQVEDTLRSKEKTWSFCSRTPAARGNP